jgi:CheY-like chemotaxis protein
MNDEKLINILLVEDDEVDIMNVQRAFRKNKINNPLFIAHNGLEALEMLRSGNIPKPHVILLDINMPK